MDMSSTPEGTGMTEAQAAESLLARYQSDEDNGNGETEGEGPQPDEDDEAPADEAEDQSDDEGDPDEGPEEPEGDEQPSQTFKVKVNGEELDVPLDELLKGYSREQDYTRKTQALAEQRKAAESEATAIADARAEYASRLERLDQILATAEPKVDQSLRQTDPAAWSAQMHELRMHQEQRQAVEAERARVASEEQQQEAKRRSEIVREEGELLLAVIPEWRDEGVASAEQQRLRRYGESIGLSGEELDGIVDHRVVVTMRKAMLFDEFQAKSKGVRAEVEQVKAARPGPKPASQSRATAEKQARQRLAEDGSTDAAVQFLMSRQRRA